MLAARSDPTYRPTLRVIDVVAIIVGTVVGAGIFRTPSLVAANAPSEAAALGAWVVGRRDLAHRRALLRGAGRGLSEPGRRLPLPGARLRHAPGLPLRVGAHHRDPDRVHRAARLRHRRLRDRARAARARASPTVYAALTVAVLTGVHVVGVRQGRLIQNRAHRRRGGGPAARDRGRVRARRPVAAGAGGGGRVRRRRDSGS